MSKIVKVRINPSSKAATVVVPATIKDAIGEFDYAEADLIDGLIVYRPINTRLSGSGLNV